MERSASSAVDCLALAASRRQGEEEAGQGGQPGPPLPQAIIYRAIAPFLRFDGPQKNQLYAVGGRNQQQDPLDTVEMFDTWNGQWVACPRMLARRAGCAASLLPDGTLLVVGGYDERGIVEGLLDSCEAFDPLRQVWTRARAMLGRARWGHGCASLGGLTYAVGGCSLQPGAPPHEAFMETLRGCEVFDPAAGLWRTCADLQVARAGARVVALADRYLAAVGGCDDVFGRAELLSTVEVFEHSSGRWSLLDLQLTTPRTTAAVAALDDRQILIIGGAPSLASAEVYRVPEAATPSPQCSTAAGEVASALALAAVAAGAETVPPGGQGGDSRGGRGASGDRLRINDIAEGRMGCQAVAIDLPAPGGHYPLCTRPCVVVVGGENGDEELEANIRQFSSVLVYDAEEERWRPENYFPAIPTPRTAMALCAGPGKIAGFP